MRIIHGVDAYVGCGRNLDLVVFVIYCLLLTAYYDC